MSISTDRRKTFGKIQHSQIIMGKLLNKAGTPGTINLM